MWRLWTAYLRPHLGAILAALIFLVIEGATLGALSKLLQPLFDKVFSAGGQDALLWVGLAIFGLFVIRAAAMVIGRTLMASISQKVAATMQVDLLSHLLRLDGSFFQQNSPGVLIERVQGDTLAVQGIWMGLITGIGRDLVGLIVLLTVAITIDPKWTAAALIGAPLLIFPSAMLQRYVRRKSVQLREQSGLRATRLDEIFHGIQAVKLNRLEGYQTERFRKILTLIRRAEVRSALSRTMMPGLIDVITGLGFFAVLWLAGGQIAAGERTIGEFMAFFTAMSLTFQPLRRLGELSGLWQVAAASLERIYALLDRQPLGQRPKVSQSLPDPAQPLSVSFDAVSFAHGETQVLNSLSFVAEAGKTTGIVGPSGAGKSTLFHLLTGLLDPDTGRVMIGSVDAATMTLQDQRRLFACVTQDTAMFDESLSENLTLGRTDLAKEAVQTALREAHLTEFVETLPLGMNTPVGPRGSALSGGQRQRVAIARALLQEAPILLLDEATSALDAQSENVVSDAMGRTAPGRTTLVIAHRLATVRDADKIVVLDKGQVVEEGNHDQLLAKGGLYAKLHGLQFNSGIEK
jgi:ATP-binding cassette, subfamily B, bacterial MsbA